MYRYEVYSIKNSFQIHSSDKSWPRRRRVSGGTLAGAAVTCVIRSCVSNGRRTEKGAARRVIKVW